jgi:hypothetical protein
VRAARLTIGAVGLAVLAYGAFLLLDTGWTNIGRTAWWLVGGVVVHDGFLAPATIVVVVIASRLLPEWARGPAAVGLVVLGSLTLLAIPVLGRFGARSDNPSLLDRNYTAGWLAVAGVVVAGVGVAAWWRRRRWAAPADESRGVEPKP